MSARSLVHQGWLVRFEGGGAGGQLSLTESDRTFRTSPTALSIAHLDVRGQLSRALSRAGMRHFLDLDLDLDGLLLLLYRHRREAPSNSL